MRKQLNSLARCYILMEEKLSSKIERGVKRKGQLPPRLLAEDKSGGEKAHLWRPNLTSLSFSR